MARTSIQLPKNLIDLNLDTRQLAQQVKLVSSKEILHFFQSEDFTPELLIHYFMATFNEPGPHQYLTNKLYSMPKKFVEYYVPQFCYMVIKIGSASMETFLEHLCSKYVGTYFKIIWCISAYSEQEKKDPKQLKVIEKLERRLEKAMVNGAVTITKDEMIKNADNVEFQIQLMKQYQEKEHRTEYISSVNKLLMNMIKLSLTLKLMEPDLRKPHLLSEIKKANKIIKKIRATHPELPYYWGISIPFQRRFEHEEASNLIVRAIESGYACFNTKTRVPYRILIETISPLEVYQKSIKLQMDSSTDTDQEDIQQREQMTEDLESQLRYHTQQKYKDDQYDQLAKFKSQSPSSQDLNEPFSPIKITQGQSSNTSPKKSRRGSWQFESSNGNHFKLFIKQKDKDSIGDLDVINYQRKRQRGDCQSFIQPKSVQLLEQIQQLESNYEVCQQNGTNKKIDVKKHGPWGDDWDLKLAALKEESPFKDFESYQIRAIMVKGGDDLRQELFAMQLIQKFDEIFRQAYLNLYLKPYEIIVTSENSGLLEFVPNTLSLDGLKKTIMQGKKIKPTLYQFFKEYFQEDFQQAQRNFIESLAGYSLVMYLLQIKDRHNGNILIDNQGHLIHIDFGFMLSTSPGNMGFEKSPFKLTKEYMELMEGRNSRQFEYFRQLIYVGFLELKKNCACLFQIVEIMMEKSNFHCFKFFNINEFRERFKKDKSIEECRKYVDKLIDDSIEDWWTVKYDQFQQLTNGIEP